MDDQLSLQPRNETIFTQIQPKESPDVGEHAGVALFHPRLRRKPDIKKLRRSPLEETGLIHQA